MPDDPDHPATTAERVALRAFRRLRSAAAPAVLAAVRAAWHQAMESDDRMRAIRDSAQVESVVRLTAQDARSQVVGQMLDALMSGYEMELNEHAEELGLEWTIGREDRQMLAYTPVGGHNMIEHAKRLAADLGWALHEEIAAGLSAAEPLADLPDRVRARVDRWSTAAASLVADAWHAGRTAAVDAMRRALGREAGDTMGIIDD
jgi:hypothetical protein